MVVVVTGVSPRGDVSYRVVEPVTGQTGEAFSEWTEHYKPGPVQMGLPGIAKKRRTSRR